MLKQSNALVIRSKLLKPKNFGHKDWKASEERKLFKLLKNGETLSKVLASFKNRSEISVKSKIQKFRIKYDLYGLDHREKKYYITQSWLKKIKPASIFEGFAGSGGLTSVYIDSGAKKIYSCEINKERFLELFKNIKTKLTPVSYKKFDIIDGVQAIEFNKNGQSIRIINSDCERIASYLYSNKILFDFVDLDPYGSAMPSLSLFLKLVNKGYLAVTYGEFHSYRLGRYDIILKSIPTLVDFSDLGLKFKKVNSVKDLHKRLISWTCLQGAFTLNYSEQRYLNPIHSEVLGSRNMLRTLYAVSKSTSLAKIINKSIAVIKN